MDTTETFETVTPYQTPYQQHAAVAAAEPAEHHVTRYSPDGFQIIEECRCGQRWLHDPVIGYPLTLSWLKR